jgi:hypothetical protein
VVPAGIPDAGKARLRFAALDCRTIGAKPDQPY